MFVNMTKKVNWNCLNIQENKLSILLIEIMQQQGGGESGRKFVEENFNRDKIVKDFINIVKKELFRTIF